MERQDRSLRLDWSDHDSFLRLTLQEWLKSFWGVSQEKHPGHDVGLPVRVDQAAKDFHMNCKRDGKIKSALGVPSTPNAGHSSLKRVWSFPVKIEPPDSWAFFLKSLEDCRIRFRGDLGPIDGA